MTDFILTIHMEHINENDDAPEVASILTKIAESIHDAGTLNGKYMATVRATGQEAEVAQWNVHGEWVNDYGNANATMEHKSQTIPEFNEEIATWIEALAIEWSGEREVRVFANYVADHMRQDENSLRRDQERRDQAITTEPGGYMSDIKITVTRSAGSDEAVVVFIDTTFEPDGSNGSPGLRILVNDGDAYTGVAYGDTEDEDSRPAHFKELKVKLADIDYINYGNDKAQQTYLLHAVTGSYDDGTYGAEHIGHVLHFEIPCHDPSNYVVTWMDAEGDGIELEANADLDLVLPDGKIVATWVVTK